MALLTADQVKDGIGITTALNTRDTALVAQIAASIGPVIESICGPVEQRTETLTTSGGVAAVLLPYRPQSITSVTEAGTVTADFYADLDAGIVYAGSRLARRIFAAGDLVVVYEVGYTTVPDHVIFAAMEQCRIWWQQGQQSTFTAYGYDGEVPQSVPMGFAISNRVRELLAPLKTLPGFA